MKKIILLIFIILNTVIFSEEYVSGKIVKKVGTVKENSLATDMELIDEEMSDIAVYQVKVGKDLINVESPIYYENPLNIDLKKGDKVILMKDVNDDGKIIYFITDKDKRINYIILSSIFIILTFVLAKIKGIKALLALVLGVASIFYFFLPLVIKGYSPILLSVITALFSSVATIYFIT
ncbi:YibE/F family protein [Fusobacterium sp.]|uniref:YibE/F family protein n=1 Tax=Fusobacterium sp. TaxID=68766 RepID=UPI00261C0255|nr:YibE/F family protein [Fusobacterium sp.]